MKIMKKKLTGAIAALTGSVLLTLGSPGIAEAAAPDASYYNRLVTLNTGMCAAVGGNSTSVGAGFIQFPCDGKYNKQFHSQWAGTNAYFLKVRSTNLCMTPESTAEHAVIRQQYCANSDLQVWVTEYMGNDNYRLRNRATGFCMGPGWGMTWSGQPLEQAACGTFAGQDWRFVMTG
ncbi:RICIN domain-containing protein [Streptomyces sp. NPDC048269]|uniref:RICIN domain-containing protein n=1 Tax=unclassified Streptomyces TaxID=2593676 RepID=UPI003438795B